MSPSCNFKQIIATLRKELLKKLKMIPHNYLTNTAQAMYSR